MRDENSCPSLILCASLSPPAVSNRTNQSQEQQRKKKENATPRPSSRRRNADPASKQLLCWAGIPLSVHEAVLSFLSLTHAGDWGVEWRDIWERVWRAVRAEGTVLLSV